MTLKRTLILLVALTLVCGSALLSAGDSNKKPVIKKGAETFTIKGVTRHWKDIKKVSLDKLSFEKRKQRPVMNFKDPRTIVKKDTAKDPVVQDSFGTLNRDAKAMQSPIKNFAGLNFASNGHGWPPDTVGDVGSTYFVQAVNISMGIFNKSTGALVSATTLDNFFGGTGISGTPCDSDNYGDPIVLYDQYAERWFILDFAWYSNYSGGSWFSIAVSKTSDPTGAWWQYALNADSSLLNDYPKCGIWHDGIYTTANMFQFTGSYQHAKIWAFKKPDIYNGTLTVQYVTDSSYQAYSILPANAKGSTAPSTSAPNYMYALDASEYGSPHIDAIYVWKYDVDWSTPANTTWTGPSTMTTASFGLTANEVPQLGTSNTLDSLYGRLMFPAMYRKFATYEAVYLCHLVEYSSRRTMRWYEIRISSGNSSIYQQSTYAPDSNHRWMGAIGADQYGNIAMGYSISSTAMYPSIRYAGRLSTDTLNQLSQGEATLIAGSGYQSSYDRWGDYSSMTIDPDDDETFWYTQEYYASSGTNWQTRIGSFKMSSTPDTTPPVISSVSSGNITSSAATITWTTDESATSEVQYGTTTSYGSSESDSGYVTSHSINLTGLSANTLYHYKVISVDGSSNSAQSGDYTFTTLSQSASPEIFVFDISMQKQSWWILYKALATITIKDTNGAVVPNATVYIQWSGKASGTSSGSTNASGQITFDSGYKWGDGTFTITVTNVTHSTLTYNSSLNNETSDSI